MGGYREEFCQFLEWLALLDIPFGGDPMDVDQDRRGLASFHVASSLSVMNSRGKSSASRCNVALV